jgi:hypothetical protein
VLHAHIARRVVPARSAGHGEHGRVRQRLAILHARSAALCTEVGEGEAAVRRCIDGPHHVWGARPARPPHLLSSALTPSSTRRKACRSVGVSTCCCGGSGVACCAAGGGGVGAGDAASCARPSRGRRVRGAPPSPADGPATNPADADRALPGPGPALPALALASASTTVSAEAALPPALAAAAATDAAAAAPSTSSSSVRNMRPLQSGSVKTTQRRGSRPSAASAATYLRGTSLVCVACVVGRCGQGLGNCPSEDCSYKSAGFTGARGAWRRRGSSRRPRHRPVWSQTVAAGLRDSIPGVPARKCYGWEAGSAAVLRRTGARTALWTAQQSLKPASQRAHRPFLKPPQPLPRKPFASSWRLVYLLQ